MSLTSRFRSGFENRVAIDLELNRVGFGYETQKVKYLKPPQDSTYTPDFILDSGVIVECKGVLKLEDRKKHLWIKEQHPTLDIRFCFQRAKNTIRKGSKTTYGEWANKHGFKWCEKRIPKSWGI